MPTAAASSQYSIHISLTGSFGDLFLRLTMASRSGCRYSSFAGRPMVGNSPSTCAAPIPLTSSYVSERSRRTFAHAETSRLLTCSDAATSAWLTPPFASMSMIFFLLDIGHQPLPCHGAPDWARSTDAKS